MDRATLGTEDRLQLGDGFESDVAARMLILGQHRRGGPVTARQRAVEAALDKLRETLPVEALEPVLLAELASPDVFSSKNIAGRVLVRMGEKSAKKGRDILLRIVESDKYPTLVTDAYWALKYMGFARAAEAAIGKRAEKQK